MTRCRAEDDLGGWTQAVLGAASVYLFGAEPGKLPAQLYDVLARTTDDGTRARLAAALARCWAYAVMFHGVTDDTLARAVALLGDADTAGRLRARALATYELLGAPWWRGRARVVVAASGRRRVPRFAPGLPASISGRALADRAGGAAAPLRALRGFG